MISEMLSDYSRTLLVMFLADAIVFLAMGVDLASGLNKAKQRGEIRSSWGLKRTLSKLITYEGGMIIMHGIDALMHASHIIELFGLTALVHVPFFSCILGMFLLIVEGISIKEGADCKTQTELTRTARAMKEAASAAVNKEVLVDALSEAIAKAIKKKEL